MKKFMMLLSLILVFVGFGCAALSHYVTPAPIDNKAVEYVVKAEVAESNDYVGFKNLEKAIRLQADVNKAHEINLFAIEQLLDEENLYFGLFTGSTSMNVSTGLAREEALFGEQGLLTLGLTMAGFGGFTGLLGLMRKRPGDITKDEFNQAMNTLGEQTYEEIESKNKHLFEIVNGISKFMETYENEMPDAVKKMKEVFDKFQDGDTKLAVQAIKKGISL